MAAVVQVGALPFIASSKTDPLCQRVNDVAVGSIMQWALLIGLGLGFIGSCFFDPLLTITLCVAVSAIIGLIYCAYLYEYPPRLIYEVGDEWESVLKGSVSHEVFREPVIAPCGHTFELDEIKKWQTNARKECPSCRRVFKQIDLRTNWLILGLLRHLHSGRNVASFINEHRFETCCLSDGHSYAIRKELLVMRAKSARASADYGEFLDANEGDIFGSNKAYYRPGVDIAAVEAVFNSPPESFDLHSLGRLEEMHTQSVENILWCQVLDHLQKSAQSS